jgi:predicted RNA-binding protein with PUA-like domain
MEKHFDSCSARLQAGMRARLQSANLKVGATIGRRNTRIEVTLMPQDYLLKTEPSEYSFADLLKDATTEWDGVSNPTAVKNLREMKPGARLIIYETGARKSAVGTATVVSVQASDPKNPKVKIKAGKSLANPVSLEAIKANKLFKDSALVRIGRLSVVPLTKEQYGILAGD